MKDETTAEFSVEGFLKFAKMVHKDDKEKYELSKEMAEECKSTTDPDPDRCDFGLKIIKCLDNAALAGNVTEDM